MTSVIRLWLVLATAFQTIACALDNYLPSAGAVGCLLVAGHLGVRRWRGNEAAGPKNAGLTWILVGSLTAYLGCVLRWPFPVTQAVAGLFFVLGIAIVVKQDRDSRGHSAREVVDD